MFKMRQAAVMWERNRNKRIILHLRENNLSVVFTTHYFYKKVNLDLFFSVSVWAKK